MAPAVRRLGPTLLVGFSCLANLFFCGCSREISGQASGECAVSLALPQGMAPTEGSDSLRIWILDADGRSILSPLSVPFDSSLHAIDYPLRVPAGEDRALWIEWTRDESAGAGEPALGTIAAGGRRGLSIEAGQVTEASVVLTATVPELFPPEATPGVHEVTLRWSRIAAALEYGLRQRQGGMTAEQFGADTFAVIPVPTADGFSGLDRLARRESRTEPSAAESTYFQVRCRLPRGSTSLFSETRAVLFSDLVGLPYVSAVLPPPGAAGVADTADVIVAFSQAMDATSLADSVVTLRTESTGTVIPLDFHWSATDTLRAVPLGALARGNRTSCASAPGCGTWRAVRWIRVRRRAACRASRAASAPRSTIRSAWSESFPGTGPPASSWMLPSRYSSTVAPGPPPSTAMGGARG